MIADGTVSGRTAKEVFELMFETGPDQGKDLSVIVEEKGLKQVTDTGAIEAAVNEVIAANPDKGASARAPENGRLVVGSDASHGRQSQPASRQQAGDAETEADRLVTETLRRAIKGGNTFLKSSVRPAVRCACRSLFSCSSYLASMLSHSRLRISFSECGPR